MLYEYFSALDPVNLGKPEVVLQKRRSTISPKLLNFRGTWLIPVLCAVSNVVIHRYTKEKGYRVSIYIRGVHILAVAAQS